MDLMPLFIKVTGCMSLIFGCFGHYRNSCFPFILCSIGHYILNSLYVLYFVLYWALHIKQFVCPLFCSLSGITGTVCMSFILFLFVHYRDSLYVPYLFQFIMPVSVTVILEYEHLLQVQTLIINDDSYYQCLLFDFHSPQSHWITVPKS